MRIKSLPASRIIIGGYAGLLRLIFDGFAMSAHGLLIPRADGTARCGELLVCARFCREQM